MTCKLDDLDLETTTYTYDAFGNPISQETKQEADEPIFLSPSGACPSGACKDDVTFEYHFSYPGQVSDPPPVPAIVEPRYYDSEEGRWLDDPMGFGAGESNLYRYHAAELEVVGFQYNQARHYDPRIGRWISGDPAGFEAGDEDLHRYPQTDR